MYWSDAIQTKFLENKRVLQLLRNRYFLGGIVVAFLFLFAVGWYYLGQVYFFIGPSNWDDVLYCDHAAVPNPRWELRNRYVHIWSIRLFNMLLDSRQFAAAVYSNILVVGLGWIGFFIGRRLGGTMCGIVAALLMPFYPALLQFISVPYVDTPMAFWSALGLLCVIIAAEDRRLKVCLFTSFICGISCYLAVKSKETGLCVLPPVIIALAYGKRKLGTIVAWIVGIVAGWMILRGLDALFMPEDSTWWGSDWSTYFGDNPSPSSKSSPGKAVKFKLMENFVGQLTKVPFLSFTLLGCAGMVRGFRENLAVRLVSIWGFCVFMFVSLIAWRYANINAESRYCVGIGVPLVFLSAYWITSTWHQNKGKELNNLYMVVPLLLGLLWISGTSIYDTIWDKPDKYTPGGMFFLTPVTVVLLFLSPWLAGGRWLTRVSLVLLIITAAAISIQYAHEDIKVQERRMRSWTKLVTVLDRENADLYYWRTKKYNWYPTWKLMRRTRILSSRPAEDFVIHEVKSPEEVKKGGILLVASTDAYRVRLKKKGWRWVSSGKSKTKKRWVAFRRPLRSK